MPNDKPTLHFFYSHQLGIRLIKILSGINPGRIISEKMRGVYPNCTIMLNKNKESQSILLLIVKKPDERFTEKYKTKSIEYVRFMCFDTFAPNKITSNISGLASNQ